MANQLMCLKEQDDILENLAAISGIKIQGPL
jgi:hypothetical protein